MHLGNFDPDGTPHHRYCTWCGTFDRGPHAGKVFPISGPDKPQAADEERVYNAQEAADVGLEHNIGSTICDDCYEKERQKLAQLRQERARQRAAETTDAAG